jgi:peptidoglycan/xylan/chitin deacetylase (PgdA/CDA1 family)
MVSMTFDDGLSGTYRYAYPILKKYGYPGTAGIIYAQLLSQNDDYMTVEQVLDLQKNGWEIASHSMTHKRPTEIPTFYRDEPLKGWILEDKQKGIFQAGYEYPLISCIFDNDVSLKRFYSYNQMQNEPGSYYFDQIIQELHVRPLHNGQPAKLNIRAGSYEREMEYSDRELEKLGFKVNTFITPYNYWTKALRGVSIKYYDYVVTGFETDNRSDKFDPHFITRTEVHSDDTVEELMRLIEEKAIQSDDWVVLCMHEIGDGIGWEPWSAQKLEQLCSWLKKEGVRVVTITRGASFYKNAE